MVVTRSKIRKWMKRADSDDEYMIVHSDDFSYEYYPTFHESAAETKDALSEAREESMHSIREVYELKANDLEKQIEADHTFRI